MSESACGLEKLILAKFTENSSHQKALQAIFSTRVDFCISGFEAVLHENEFFNSHACSRQAMSPQELVNPILLDRIVTRTTRSIQNYLLLGPSGDLLFLNSQPSLGTEIHSFHIARYLTSCSASL
jgi:hypothetical protein